MLRTANRRVVASAKAFVGDLCRNELTPGAIDRLNEIYRPPRLQGNLPATRKRAASLSPRQNLPRVFVTHLVRGDPPIGSENTEEVGFRIAKSRRKRKREYVLQNFNWSGRAPFRRGDKIVQVVREAGGERLVDAPGEVLYTREWRRARRRVTFVYLELPRVRRVRVELLASRLGYGSKKKLLRGGLIRDRGFADALLGQWTLSG